MILTDSRFKKKIFSLIPLDFVFYSFNESDFEFIASEGDADSDDGSIYGSESSDEVEKMPKEIYKRSRQIKRVGTNSSQSSSEEPSSSRSCKRIRMDSSDDEPVTRKPRVRQRRSKRRTKRNRVRVVKMGSDSEEDTGKIKTQLKSSDEESSRSVPLDTPMAKLNLLKCLQIPLRKLTKEEIYSGFVFEEANEKDNKERLSSDGDTEPEHDVKPSLPIVNVSSDESDVETKINKTSRRANIQESEDSEGDEGLLLKIPFTKPRSWKKVSSSSSSEDLDGDLSDGFVISDHNTQKKESREKIENRSDSSSEDDEKPLNLSILSQIAPDLLRDLRRETTLVRSEFDMICKLFIMDQLNSKSIDKAYQTSQAQNDKTGEANSSTRSAIRKLENSLGDSMSKCVTGAWNAVMRRRIDIHPNMSHSHIYPKWKCSICNRRRKCTDRIHLFGADYNRTSLRVYGKSKGELEGITDEEKPIMTYSPIDEAPGIEFNVGPSCYIRMNLYHEARHYKIQLYQCLTDEFHAQLARNSKLRNRYETANRCNKNRVIGEDLEDLTEDLLKVMEGTIAVSFTQFNGITTRAHQIDIEAGYQDE